MNKMYYVFWITALGIILVLMLTSLDRINDSLSRSNVEIAELRKAITYTAEEMKGLRTTTVKLDSSMLEKELEKISRQLEEVIRWIKLK